MKIIPAKESDFSAVQTITVNTIAAVYPHYYPAGAVDFFLAHHNDDSIRKDLADGIVFLCLDAENCAVGTVTVRENEICRLFVLPECQGNGFGRALLDFAEDRILKQYPQIRLDASFPAKQIYLKRDYQVIGYHMIETPAGDFLCYDEMIKCRMK
ncbi:MAG TPA: GNAT family N-acetyltransferase [Ruminococcus sp.]|nr:GNAT family N-acetyltransferase [Ruminococcus sp.]